MYVAVNQPSVVALLAGIMALSYGQLMNNELVPSTLNEGLSVNTLKCLMKSTEVHNPHVIAQVLCCASA